MMNLAELVCQDTEDQSISVRPEPEELRIRTIQCLILADYTNPELYTIETLMLYNQAEWMTSQDSIIEVSLVLGMIIRLAMSMGIHRDSKAHPLTAFQGEMRRRIWAMLRQMDILYSFQLSLPVTIDPKDSNCSFPRNIHDAEFDEHSPTLPPSKSADQMTEVSYSMAKSRLSIELGKMLALLESKEPSLDDVVKYKRSWEEVREHIPPFFQMHYTGPTANEPLASLRKKAIGIDRVYQIGLCMLYRRFLSPARLNPALLPHRGACVDAAMTLLNHQAAIYSDIVSYPQHIKNRHISTLTTHDFFIAGMAIALDLHYGIEMQPLNRISGDISLWGYDRTFEMITALKTSIEFWRLCKDESFEAAKAFGMFSFVLTKVARYMSESGMPFDSSFSNEPLGEEMSQPGLELTSNGLDGLANFDWVRRTSSIFLYLLTSPVKDLWDSYNDSGADFNALINGHSPS